MADTSAVDAAQGSDVTEGGAGSRVDRLAVACSAIRLWDGEAPMAAYRLCNDWW